MNQIKHYLAPPVFEDQEKMMAVRLMHPLLLLFILLMSIITPILVAFEPEAGVRFLVGAGTAMVAGVLALWLVHRGHVQTASRVLIAAIWIAMAFLAITGSGVTSPAYLTGFLALIALSGLLLGSRGSILVAGASTLFGLFMLIFGAHRIWSPEENFSPEATWVTAVFLYWAVTLVQSSFSHLRQEAMQQVRAELAERQLAEQALRKSEERYRLISEVSSGFVYSMELDAQGLPQIDWVAGAFESMTGYTLESLSAAGGWANFIHSEDAQTVAQALQPLAANQPVTVETRIIHRSGEVRWVEVFAHPEIETGTGRLLRINGAVQDIRARKQAEENMRRTLEREQRVNDVVRIISSALDLETVASTVVRLGAELVNADMGSLALLSSDGECLIETYNYNLPPHLFNPRPFSRGEGLGWAVLETGQTVNVAHYQDHPLAMAYAIQAGIQAFLGVPVTAGERILGVLKLVSLDPARQFSASDQALAVAIGQQAGVYIQNARLFEQTQQRAQQLSTLNEVGQAVATLGDLPSVMEITYQQARRSLHLDVFYVCLYDAATSTLEFPLVYDSGKRWDAPEMPLTSNSLTNQVIRTAQAMIVNRTPDELNQPALPYSQVGDTSRRSASLLIAPLRAGEQVIGAISAQSYTLYAYVQSDLELLIGIANQVATAIQNARLFEATRRQLEDLSLLHQISTAAVEARDEADLVQRAVKSLGQQVFADYMAIWLLDAKTQMLRCCALFSQKLPVQPTIETIPLHTGVVGTTAADGQARRIPDVAQEPLFIAVFSDIRSELCIPMRVTDRVLGVINMESKQPDAFSDADERLFSTIAGLLATAIERLRSEAELEQRVRERTSALEAANQELESFSYSVSHDLRAPLRGIDGYSRLLQADHADQLSAEAQYYLDMVRMGAQRMGRLIDDLLQFSRLSRQPIKKEDVSPSRLVEEVLIELKPLYVQRQVEFTLQELPTCQADPHLLYQVWMNLVENALKYSSKRERACVEVGWQEQEGEVAYFVRDNGVGFDMRFADRVFGVFQRLHRSEEFEGTGVGLAIVQRIIRRHGGRVWAEAEEDKGATFYFTV